MRYVTLSELIYINGRILNNAQIMAGKQKVRDLVLLEAAAARPAASAFGADAYPSLGEKAAALFHSIARNHPFTDGNKRAATVAALFMFSVNGYAVTWDPTEALAMIVAVSENRRSLADLAAWWPLRARAEEAEESVPEPDAERDMHTIDRIIQEHRWLLDELSRQ